MIARRTLLKTTLSMATIGSGWGSMAWAQNPISAANPNSISAELLKTTLRVPAEGMPHAATWMAYGATKAAWTNGPPSTIVQDYSESRLIARHDLMRIAVASRLIVRRLME